MLPVGGNWFRLGQGLEGENPGDSFGYSVDISSDGSRMIVGAIFHDSAAGLDAGRAQVFALNRATDAWEQVGQNLDGRNALDFSGGFVRISSDGSVVAVGAPGEDSNGENAGATRVYKYDTSTDEWIQRGQDLIGESAGDESGVVLSLSSAGDVIAIGGFANDNGGSDAGHARVYKYNPSDETWELLGQELVGEASGDNFGVCVDLSANGKILAVGAWQSDGSHTNAGRVRIFQYDEDDLEWIQLGQDLDGDAAEDAYGISVALSADGLTVVAGGYASDGVNGVDSGHVKAYRYDPQINHWLKLGQDIDGEGEGDASGWTVDVSADGNILAVGAYANDGNGSNSGHIRLFQYDPSVDNWVQLGQDIDGEATQEFFGTWVALSDDGSIVAAGGDGGDTGHARVYGYTNI